MRLFSGCQLKEINCRAIKFHTCHNCHVLLKRTELVKRSKENAPTAKAETSTVDDFQPHKQTMQLANQSAQNNALASSQETGKLPKIEDPAIIAALQKAAHALNLSPSEIIETLLADFTEQMQGVPSEYIANFSMCFPHRTEAEAEVAAERIAELAASDALEGKTKFTVACEVVEAEGEDGFLVRVNQLRPARKSWIAADAMPDFSHEIDEEDDADWWK